MKHLAELRDIEHLLDTPVMTVNGREEIHMSSDQAEAVAKTPREWLELTKKGYVPRTTYDIKAEGWFKAAVLPKMLLAAARPARVSHLRDFRLTDRPLEHLPPQLGVMPSPDGEDPMERYNRGETWQEICPTLHVEVKGEYSIIVEDDYEQNYIDLLAWADFDGDGIEDILVSTAGYATQGTLCSYCYVVLTRKEPRGRLMLVEEY
jgi:hypothetical protein